MTTYQRATEGQLRAQLRDLDRAAEVIHSRQTAIRQRLNGHRPPIDHDLDARLTTYLLALEADRHADRRRASIRPAPDDSPETCALRRSLLVAAEVWHDHRRAA
jgi:hypothetical protein